MGRIRGIELSANKTKRNTTRRTTMIVKEAGGDFTPAPAGSHVARCYGMVSLGTQLPNNPTFKPTFKVLLMFELPDEPLGDSGKVMTVFKEYSASLSEKANLRHDLEGWRGRSFTKEELGGFDVVQVVGHPCMLSIIHKQSGSGRTYAAITSISKLPKAVQCPVAVNDKVIYEIEHGKSAIYSQLPEFIQKKISSCVEWSEDRVAPEEPVSPESNEGEEPQGDVPF